MISIAEQQQENENRMKTLPRILLSASVMSVGIGLTGPGSDVWYGILVPTGALLFIVAFVVHVVSQLEREHFQADCQLQESPARRRAPKPTRAVPLATEKCANA